MCVSYTVPQVSIMMGQGGYLLLLDAEASQEAILDGFCGTAERQHGGGGRGGRGVMVSWRVLVMIFMSFKQQKLLWELVLESLR